MKRVSKKQKRVRANKNSKRKAAQKGVSAAAKKKLLAKARHLWLGKEHEIDRAAAEKLRQFPHVPRKKQSPFPKDVELGFTGHFHKGGFVMQDKETFEEEFVSNAENAWYWREDKRGNRVPRRQDSGMLETNAAMSAGLSMVLADLVRLGELTYVRKVVQMAGEAGMRLICERSGYLPGYMALHPDSEGTLSIHSGLWTVDPERHVLVGGSAGGKRGRRGLRTLGDCFISLQRHHRAIGLPEELMYLPNKNLQERDPDDWAASEEMDRVLRKELGKLPNGDELLKRAEQYQREAAEDWLRRYRGTKAGVDKTHAELTEAKKRVRELKRRLKKEQEVTEQTRLAMKSLFKFPSVMKFLRSFGEVWKIVEGLLQGLGLKYEKPATATPADPDMPQPRYDAERAPESPVPAEASQNVAKQIQAEPADGAADKRRQLDKELERRRRERLKSKDSPEMGM